MANRIELEIAARSTARAPLRETAAGVREIGTAAKQMSSEVRQSATAMDELARKSERMNRTATAMGAIGTAGVGVGIGAVLAADKLDMMEKSLAAVEGSTAGAVARFRELEELGEGPSFNTATAVQGYQRLRRYMETAEQTEGAMYALAAATTSAMTGNDGLNRAMIAVQRSYREQRITAENMNQLMDAGVDAMYIWNRQMGLSREEITQMGSTAAGTDYLMKSLFRGILTDQTIMKTAAANADTLTNALENLKDDAFGAGGALGGPFLDPVKKGVNILDSLLERIKKLNPETQKWIGATAAGVTTYATLASVLLHYRSQMAMVQMAKQMSRTAATNLETAERGLSTAQKQAAHASEQEARAERLAAAAKNTDTSATRRNLTATRELDAAQRSLGKSAATAAKGLGQSALAIGKGVVGIAALTLLMGNLDRIMDAVGARPESGGGQVPDDWAKVFGIGLSPDAGVNTAAAEEAKRMQARANIFKTAQESLGAIGADEESVIPAIRKGMTETIPLSTGPEPAGKYLERKRQEALAAGTSPAGTTIAEQLQDVSLDLMISYKREQEKQLMTAGKITEALELEAQIQQDLAERAKLEIAPAARAKELRDKELERRKTALEAAQQAEEQRREAAKGTIGQQIFGLGGRDLGDILALGRRGGGKWTPQSTGFATEAEKAAKKTEDAVAKGFQIYGNALEQRIVRAAKRAASGGGRFVG